jgi:hypothetical protein
MRRIAVMAAVTLLLAFPAVAVAKTLEHNFTLGKAGRVFKLKLAHTGRIQIVLRYSRIRHPKADIIVSLASPTDPEGNVVIDSANKSSCQAAGDSRVCSVYISGEPPGKYQVRVGLETASPVAAHLRLSWPAV